MSLLSLSHCFLFIPVILTEAYSFTFVLFSKCGLQATRDTTLLGSGVGYKSDMSHNLPTPTKQQYKCLRLGRH